MLPVYILLPLAFFPLPNNHPTMPPVTLLARLKSLYSKEQGTSVLFDEPPLSVFLALTPVCLKMCPFSPSIRPLYFRYVHDVLLACRSLVCSNPKDPILFHCFTVSPVLAPSYFP